ncbi:MAG: flavodoxin domain-containing protein, partial [Kofleriaceae bacterium]
EMLAHCLQSDCLVAELANSALRSTPPPEDYDAVVFVSPIRSGRHAPSIAEYLSAHHLALATMPTFFVEPNRESVVHVSELAKAIGDEIPALLT